MDDFFNGLLTYDNDMLEHAIGGLEEAMPRNEDSGEAYTLVVAVCKDIIARRRGGATTMDEDKEEAQDETGAGIGGTKRKAGQLQANDEGREWERLEAVKGIVNSRERDGGVQYKVRYAGLDKSGDEWLSASAVSADHVQNFEARKAKKSAAAKGGAEAPKPEEKKRKAPEVRAPAPPAPPRP